MSKTVNSRYSHRSFMITASKNYFTAALLRAFLLLAVILSVIITVGLLIISQNNRALTVKYPQAIDPRLEGVNGSGWTEPSFTFVDPTLIAGSVTVGFAFDAVRPPSAGPARVIFEVNGTTLPEQVITREPIYLTPASWRETVVIRAKVLNPFFSNESNEERGVKIARVIVNGSPFIAPSIYVLAPIVFFVTLLTILSLLVAWKHDLLSLRSGSAITAIVWIPLFYLFAANSFTQWSVAALWLLIPLCVLVSGLLIPLQDDGRSKTSINGTHHRLYVAALFALFIFALWIRISTVSFGLPELFHPDESRKINIMRRIILTGDLDPDYFRHPSFMLYSGALVGKLYSLYHNIPAPTVTELAPLGRGVSSVLGALSVLILFQIGKLLYGRAAGLAAAFALAVCPLHVVCSRYIKEDVCMIFFMLVTLWLVLKFTFQRSSSLWILLLAGLTAGFATSVKYTGILAAPFLAAPLLVLLLGKLNWNAPYISTLVADARKLPVSEQQISTLLKTLIVSGILVAIGFLVITPFSILNSERFINDFLFEGKHMSTGHSGVISALNYFWSFHLHTSVFKAFGNAATWIGLFSLTMVLARKDIASLVPLLGFLLFYLPAEWVNAKPFPQAERYILPTLPFLALSIGYFLQQLSNVSERKKTKIPLIIVGILLLAPSTYFTLSHRAQMMDDTRTEAKEWVEQNIPHGTKLVTDWYFYGPNLSRTNYDIFELKTPDNAEVLRSMSIKSLQETGGQYFITSSSFYDRYLFLATRGHQTGMGYKELFRTLKPIAEFSRPESAQYGFHNPTIKVFRIPQ